MQHPFNEINKEKRNTKRYLREAQMTGCLLGLPSEPHVLSQLLEVVLLEVRLGLVLCLLGEDHLLEQGVVAFLKQRR
jgi:hypothetical protein